MKLKLSDIQQTLDIYNKGRLMMNLCKWIYGLFIFLYKVPPSLSLYG